MNFSDCAAVCDVDKNHVEKGRSTALKKQSKPGAERSVEMFEDYRKLLDRKDIDVVTIVTPDHWHTKIAIEAMKAGKDVKRIPMTFGEALEALDNDEVIKASMPGDMYRVFRHYKWDEWERYCATVTDWDVQEYLDILP